LNSYYIIFSEINSIVISTISLYGESLLLPRCLDNSGRDRQSSFRVGRGGGYGMKERTRNKYLRCFVRLSRSSFIKCYYNFLLIQNEIQCGPRRKGKSVSPLEGSPSRMRRGTQRRETRRGTRARRGTQGVRCSEGESIPRRSCLPEDWK
jgi:hypothetical protein